MSSDFDIYQTESGYVAVTNEVRRQILTALAKRDRQLPELVKLTRKAKPTLSSVHMKELLAQNLVEELHHPTDKRKKIYRLKARRVGSSSLPVDQLRSAVRQYAAGSLAPGPAGQDAGPAAAPPALALAVDAIADAPPEADVEVLRRQARRLGTLSAAWVQGGSARELVMGVAAFLEREGVARPLRMDLEALTLEAELAPGLAPGAPAERLVQVVGALAEGACAGKGVAVAPEAASVAGAARRFVLSFGAPAAQKG